MAEAPVTYAGFIAGKRVAFVAPARAFLGCGKGVEIDSHDIVVRTNHFPFILDKYADDFGSRCDVLYVNMQYAREMFPLPIGYLKKRGLKWICFKGLGDENRKLYGKHFHVRQVDDKINKIVREKVPSYTYGNAIWTDILECNPESLTLYCTDFFANRKRSFGPDLYDNYLPGYLPDKIINQGNQINVNIEEHDHDFMANAAYTAELFTKYRNFEADDACGRILRGILSGEIDQK